MMLRLEALSPAEGIGIIRVDHTLRLIRPPYLSQDTPVLAENALEDAILRHGFSASTEQFGSWEDVITFLNQQAVDVRRSMGQTIPESINGKDILDVAPLDRLNSFLDRIEQEIIPQRLFDQADEFLLSLLASSASTRHPETGSRAVRLLQRNTNARKQSEARVSELANRDIRFPSLERHGELEESVRLAELIRERGCIFAPAS